MSARVWGIALLEYAPVSADGSLPTTGWKPFRYITNGSVTLTVPEPTTNDITVEDIDGVIDVLPTADVAAPTLSLASVQIDGNIAADFLDGTYDAATDSYDAPAAGTQIVHKAFRMTSRPHRGKQMQFHFKDAAVIPNISGNFTKGELLSLAFTARCTTPTDETGAPVSPWGWKIITIPPTT